MSDSTHQFRLVDYRKVHPDAKGSHKHYLVYSEDVCCGSIYASSAHGIEFWLWNVNGWEFYEYNGNTGQRNVGGHGRADTREKAMQAWKTEWERSKPDLDAIRAEHEKCDRRPEPINNQAENYERMVQRDREAHLARMAGTGQQRPGLLLANAKKR